MRWVCRGARRQKCATPLESMFQLHAPAPAAPGAWTARAKLARGVLFERASWTAHGVTCEGPSTWAHPRTDGPSVADPRCPPAAPGAWPSRGKLTRGVLFERASGQPTAWPERLIRTRVDPRTNSYHEIHIHGCQGVTVSRLPHGSDAPSKASVLNRVKLKLTTVGE